MPIVPELDAFIRRMPKAEIHLHLEGSVRPSTVLDLSRRHGTSLPATTEEELAQYFTFRDFDHFIECYIAVCNTLRTPEDFERIVRELGEDCAAQNIRYVEVHFNPATNVRKRGLDFRAMLDGMNAGRRDARDRFGVEMRWIADGVRDEGPEHRSVARTVEWIAALDPSEGVVGLGLGGSEVGFPPTLYQREFAMAREAGLHVVAHAGETTGPQTIIDSLNLLGAERIGHGIRAIEDPSLVARLALDQIPLEVCPTSNVCTRVTATMQEHPFPLLDRAGVLVTINSDDPPLFGTTLTDEFRVLADHWGYRSSDLQRIAGNAVRASFLPERDRAALLGVFRAETEILREDLGVSD